MPLPMEIAVTIPVADPTVRLAVPDDQVPPGVTSVNSDDAPEQI